MASSSLSLRSLVQPQPSRKQHADVELGVLPRPIGLEQPPTPPATAAVAPPAVSAAAAPPCFDLWHRFAAGQAAVSVIKFARGSADVLAWGDAAGSVFLATAAEPPRLLQVGMQRMIVAHSATGASGL